MVNVDDEEIVGLLDETLEEVCIEATTYARNRRLGLNRHEEQDLVTTVAWMTRRKETITSVSLPLSESHCFLQKLMFDCDLNSDCRHCLRKTSLLIVNHNIHVGPRMKLAIFVTFPTSLRAINS